MKRMVAVRLQSDAELAEAIVRNKCACLAYARVRPFTRSRSCFVRLSAQTHRAVRALYQRRWRTAKWARPRISLALRQRGIGREDAEPALDALFVRGEGTGPAFVHQAADDAGESEAGETSAWGEDEAESALDKDLYQAALRQWRCGRAAVSLPAEGLIAESAESSRKD